MDEFHILHKKKKKKIVPTLLIQTHHNHSAFTGGFSAIKHCNWLCILCSNVFIF